MRNGCCALRVIAGIDSAWGDGIARKTKRDGGDGNRTRVQEHFNKGYYMLSISFNVLPSRLPYAGFGTGYLK